MQYREWRDYTDELEMLKIRVANTEKAMKDCADELEAHIIAHYGDTLHYPDQKRRFDRDMKPVLEARKLLNPESVS